MKITNKILFLDMDGTIADLYNYPDWCTILSRPHVRPAEVYNMFRNLKPMICEEELMSYCEDMGGLPVIYTMTPWDVDQKVEEVTVQAKVEWLSEYFPSLKNVIITRYINNKNLPEDSQILYYDTPDVDNIVAPKSHDILIDDSELFRNSFIGISMSPPWLV